MPEITNFSPNPLDYRKDYFDLVNQKSIENTLDQITNFLTKRLKRFEHEFEKQFGGYTPEQFSGLIHLQKIKIATRP